MKRINKLYAVLFCITPTIILSGCNAGLSAVGSNPAKVNQKVNAKQSNGLRDNINADTIGAPADIVSDQAQKVNVDAKYGVINDRGTTCLNLTRMKSTVGEATTNTTITIASDAREVYDKLFTSASVSGGFGIYSASLEAAYTKEMMSTNKGLNIVSSMNVAFPVAISPSSSYKGNYLNDYSVNELNSDKEKFIQECGNGYVSQLLVGQRVITTYTLDFGSSSDKDIVQLALGASVKDVVELKSKLETLSQNLRNKITLNATTKVTGGISTSKTVSCDGGDMSICMDKIIANENEYKQDLVKQMLGLKDKLASSPNAETSLHIIEGSMISLDNNAKFSGYTSYDKVDMTTPPGLVEKQEQLENMIKQAAALGADGSIINSLKDLSAQQNLSPSAIASMQDLIQNANKYQKYIDVITSRSFASNMINACYGFTESNCEEFMKTALIKPTGENAISPNDFIKTLETIKNVPILKEKGLYSDANPYFANVFWLPLDLNKPDEVDYFPIVLNSYYDYAKDQSIAFNNVSQAIGDTTFITNNYAWGMVKGPMVRIAGSNISNNTPVDLFFGIPNGLYVSMDKKSGLGMVHISSNSPNPYVYGAMTNRLYKLKFDDPMRSDSPVRDYSAYISGSQKSGYVDGVSLEYHQYTFDKYSAHEHFLLSFFRGGANDSTILDAMKYRVKKPFMHYFYSDANDNVEYTKVVATPASYNGDNKINVPLTSKIQWCSSLSGGQCMYFNDITGKVELKPAFEDNSKILDKFKGISSNIYPRQVALSRDIEENKSSFTYNVYDGGTFRAESVYAGIGGFIIPKTTDDDPKYEREIVPPPPPVDQCTTYLNELGVKIESLYDVNTTCYQPEPSVFFGKKMTIKLAYKKYGSEGEFTEEHVVVPGGSYSFDKTTGSWKFNNNYDLENNLKITPTIFSMSTLPEELRSYDWFTMNNGFYTSQFDVNGYSVQIDDINSYLAAEGRGVRLARTDTGSHRYVVTLVVNANNPSEKMPTKLPVPVEFVIGLPNIDSHKSKHKLWFFRTNRVAYGAGTLDIMSGKIFGRDTSYIDYISGDTTKWIARTGSADNTITLDMSN